MWASSGPQISSLLLVWDHFSWIMPRWADLQCFSIVLTCLWASDPSDLRMWASAASSVQVVCVKLRGIASRIMDAWKLLHPAMNLCLKAMACSATLSERGGAVQFWNPLNVPYKDPLIRCSVNCCRKVVGDSVPVCQHTHRRWASLRFPDATSNIYGDSDYFYPAIPPNRPLDELHAHKHSIVEALRSINEAATKDIFLGGGVQAWIPNSRDLTGYVCPVVPFPSASHHTTRLVSGIALVCSKECYKIAKLIARDRSSDQDRARFGLQHLPRDIWPDDLYLCFRGVDAFDFFWLSSPVKRMWTGARRAKNANHAKCRMTDTCDKLCGVFM